ncbi:MAG TPA: glycosyltransferase family 4 protein [Chloroflexota bacterium]|nr:glycosyltransferase family 4 protein [Chloroflexota bacterium]
MRIALIYDAVYPYVKGGAERRYFEIARRLSIRHEVTLVSFGWWKDTPPADAGPNLKYLSVGKPRALYREDGTRAASEALLFGAAVVPTLLRERFDIVDCCSFPYFSVLSARMVTAGRRLPFVVTWHEHWGPYWREYWGWKGALGRLVEQAAVAASPLSISVSEFTRKRLLAGRFGRSPESVVTIPNGIDLDVISAAREGPDPVDLVYVGRLMPHKRVDLLIEAIGVLRDQGRSVRCRIVGDGPERSRLVDLAEGLGVSQLIEFTGFVPESQVYEIMKSARALVLTSEREGFGNVVLEANGCGIPAIVARGPESASAELVRENITGRTCSLSAVSVADAIADVLDDSSRFRKDDCIAHAQGFDWTKVSDRVLDIYESVLSEH